MADSSSSVNKLSVSESINEIDIMLLVCAAIPVFLDSCTCASVGILFQENHSKKGSRNPE